MRSIFSWPCAAFAAFTLAAGAPDAGAQSSMRFKPITIVLNEAGGVRGALLPGSTITDPAQIFDETFIYLDLRVVLDAASAEDAVAAISDLSPTGTEQVGFCGPGLYGKLDMGADLAYLVRTTTDDGVSVTGHIYAGDRSENPYNDVFCGFEGKPEQAELRLRGFFFVMRDRTDRGVFVQLRPVNPTPQEAERFWTEIRPNP